MMKLKEYIKKFFKKLPKVYKQPMLIEFKIDLAKQIKRVEVLSKKAKEQRDVQNLLNFKLLRKQLANDQKKVKLAIAKNNSRLRINKLIYKREEIAKELEFLQIISKDRDNHKNFFEDLKEKKFIIETAISDLQKKLQNIENKLAKRNNSFFTNILLMLETV